MRKKQKKLSVWLMTAALCAATVALQPVEAYAAGEVNTASGFDELITVETTQRCSIWSAPATVEENRVKYVDEGYQIQIYPQPVSSELGDGKTFYRTIKGAYVLCRVVVSPDEKIAADEGSAVTGAAVEPLVPVGNVPWRDRTYDGSDLEMWLSYRNDAEALCEWGIEIVDCGSYTQSVTGAYGVTYRGYLVNEAAGIVGLVAGDEEIAQFLREHGDRILVCSCSSMFGEDEWGGILYESYKCAYGSVDCQRGECVCIVTNVGMDAYDEGMRYGVSPQEAMTNCLRSIMNDPYWQEALSK